MLRSVVQVHVAPPNEDRDSFFQLSAHLVRWARALPSPHRTTGDPATLAQASPAVPDSSRDVCPLLSAGLVLPAPPVRRHRRRGVTWRRRMPLAERAGGRAHVHVPVPRWIVGFFDPAQAWSARGRDVRGEGAASGRPVARAGADRSPPTTDRQAARRLGCRPIRSPRFINRLGGVPTSMPPELRRFSRRWAPCSAARSESCRNEARRSSRCLPPGSALGSCVFAGGTVCWRSPDAVAQAWKSRPGNQARLGRQTHMLMGASGDRVQAVGDSFVVHMDGACDSLVGCTRN